MHAHLFKSSEFRSMPWKNGAGQTTQLAIEPKDATLDTGFKWRLSMADVRMDGPFSPFPDYERTILLLKGKGIDLDFNGHGKKRLATPLDPFQFPGEWPAMGELLDGPCMDFNVITHKGLTQQVSVLRPDPRAVLSGKATTLLFCAQGCARVTPPGQLLKKHDLLRLDDVAVVEVSSEGPDTVVIAITIGPE